MVICILYALRGGLRRLLRSSLTLRTSPQLNMLAKQPRGNVVTRTIHQSAHAPYAQTPDLKHTRLRLRIQQPGKTAGVRADTLLGWVTLAGEFTAPLAVVMGCHSGIWVSFKERALLEPFRIALRRQAPCYTPHWPWVIKSDSTLAHYDLEIFLLCLTGCFEPSFT